MRKNKESVDYQQAVKKYSLQPIEGEFLAPARKYINADDVVDYQAISKDYSRYLRKDKSEQIQQA